jgi:predicted nucleic acid-binding protein
MTFIIDASVTMSWYLAEEAGVAGKLAFERLGAAAATAPVLWWFEVRNALVVNERRGRLDTAATVGISPISTVFRSGWTSTRTAMPCSLSRASTA